jgi:glycosyltransferase involved in cell wall biosynthesis
LDSVLRQTYDNLEIVVVDDCSSDGTSKEFGSLGGITFIGLTSTVGAAAARNIGVRRSGADYVAFLDSDDEWLPDKLEMQMAVLEHRPDVGAVYSRHISMDDRTGHTVVSPGELYRGSIQPLLLEGRCPHTTSLFLVRRRAFDETGGFDEALPGFQDTDLWIRMAAAWNFDFVDEPLVVVHAHSGTRLTTNLEQRTAAVEAFLLKWGDRMEEAMGPGGLRRYRRNKLSVALGARILEDVEIGRRREAVIGLSRYLSVAGLTRPLQLAGLVAAVLFGPGSHARLKLILARE